MNTNDKQFLANLGAVMPGESTDQLIKLMGGAPADSGARKAAIMHAVNAGNIDKQVIVARKRSDAQVQRKRDNAGFKAKRHQAA